MDERGYSLLRIIALMGPLEVEDLVRISVWLLGDEVDVLEVLGRLEEERLIHRRGPLIEATLKGLEAVARESRRILTTSS